MLNILSVMIMTIMVIGIVGGYKSILRMEIKLYGSPQTRSPLVNWYLLEKKIPFKQMPPRPNPNMFGQIPYLTDDEGVEIFESGAILLYLADAYGGEINDPKKRAQYTKVNSNLYFFIF
jgi:glutathione S-transferase